MSLHDNNPLIIHDDKENRVSDHRSGSISVYSTTWVLSKGFTFKEILLT